MSDPSDPVDRALQSLGGRQFPHAAGNADLEHRLMQSYGSHSHSSLLARHRVLVPTVAILAVAAAGFAAVGGVGLVKSWFATVTVNGQVVHSGEVVPDENGQVTITLPQGSAPPDGQKQVSVTLDGDAPAGSGTMTVTVTGDKDELNVQTESQPATEPESQEK